MSKITRREFVKTGIIAFWAAMVPGYFELFLDGEPVEPPATIEHDKPEIVSRLEEMVKYMRQMAGNPPNLGFNLVMPEPLFNCLMDSGAKIGGVTFLCDDNIKVAHGPGGLCSSDMFICPVQVDGEGKA